MTSYVLPPHLTFNRTILRVCLVKGQGKKHGIEALVDVRRYPVSRRNPQFSRESLSAKSRMRYVLMWAYMTCKLSQFVPNPLDHPTLPSLIQEHVLAALEPLLIDVRQAGVGLGANSVKYRPFLQ